MLFTRYENNPIIKPESKNNFETVGTFNPAAAVHNNKIYIIYRALDNQNKSSLCLAISDDGYTFKKHPGNPIIQRSKSGHEKGGCEDPRITKIGDTYYLLYTSYTGKRPVTPDTINESMATSHDMVHWKKQGIIMKGEKSAALYHEKIEGKYVMFIGGLNIRVATSSNLKNWKLEEKPILKVRKDKFDSKFVEVGPPPFKFEDKLVLFFNTTNNKSVFQLSLALLKNSCKVVYRAEKPLMKPVTPYEKFGLIKNVIFATGLVEWKEQYFLYYGGADTTINVATVSKKKMEQYLSSLL